MSRTNGFYLLITLLCAFLLNVAQVFDEAAFNFRDAFFQFLFHAPIFLALFLMSGTIVSKFLISFDEKTKVYRPFLKLFLELIIVVSLAFFSSYILLLLSFEFSFRSNLDDETRLSFSVFFILFIFNSAIVAFWEFQIYNEKRKLEQQRKEEILKLDLNVQHEALKRQVNPHFFFNSLSALSTLIYEDVERSDIFIQKFSRVFRYVLNRYDSLVSIEEEAKLIDAFTFIHEIRHSEFLKVIINLKEAPCDMKVPHLSSHIVLESIFTNNRISKSSPLTIEIYYDQKNLVIKSKDNLKEEALEDQSRSFERLASRYRATTNLKPQAYLKDDYQITLLPLISEEKDKEPIIKQYSHLGI